MALLVKLVFIVKKVARQKANMLILEVEGPIGPQLQVGGPSYNPGQLSGNPGKISSMKQSMQNIKYLHSNVK